MNYCTPLNNSDHNIIGINPAKNNEELNNKISLTLPFPVNGICNPATVIKYASNHTVTNILTI